MLIFPIPTWVRRLLIVVVTIACSQRRSFLLNQLVEFFVGQEADITDARCWLSPDFIHAEMLRQHLKRTDLPVQLDLN